MRTRSNAMSRLIAALMRHGAYQQPDQVPSAHLPHPLTREGEEQARSGADELRATLNTHQWQLDPVIDASTLLRAWQTAEVVATTVGDQAVETFDALAERSVGSVANLTERAIEDVIEKDPRHDPLPQGWKSDSNFKLPFIGAESLVEAGDRVARHLRERIAKVEARAAEAVVKLFVGHGGAFRHAAAALGVMSVAEARARSMYYGSVVFLEVVPDGPWRHIGGDWKMRRSKDEQPD